MDIDTQLQQLDGFTGLIASVIESGDWDGLNVVLANRQDMLGSLCASELTSQEREAVVNMMVSIQATDQQFLAQVQSQKDVLQKQAASLAHDRKAAKAYQVE